MGANARWRQRGECGATRGERSRPSHRSRMGRHAGVGQTLWRYSRHSSGRVGRLPGLQARCEMGRTATTAPHILDAPAGRRRSELVVVRKPYPSQRGSRQVDGAVELRTKMEGKEVISSAKSSRCEPNDLVSQKSGIL